MKLIRRFVIGICKSVSWISRSFHLGSGATWPGQVALMISPHILSSLARGFKKGVILVAGTNGKTTTALMIATILEAQGLKVVSNTSGANLVNGIISACIGKAQWNGSVNADWGVFEVDENSLPEVIKSVKSIKSKVIIVLLNLFRDQLDRYGEVDMIAQKWQNALQVFSLQSSAVRQNHLVKIVANADDPLIAHFGKTVCSRPALEARGITYFGLDDPTQYKKTMEHATDSVFCLNCGSRLTYNGMYYSHIGVWKCLKCGEKRPKPDLSQWDYPLPGLYNRYNTLAAVASAQVIGIADLKIKEALKDFSPAFGRQEEIEIDGPTSPDGLRGASRKIKIFLSKNPAGFNQSLRTVLELGGKQLLIVLNDRIPDGRDVSWIWDVDFDVLSNRHELFVAGGRCYDLALRLKYANLRVLNSRIYTNLKKAVMSGLDMTKSGETFYILPTYSAMLEVRKILTGKKIL